MKMKHDQTIFEILNSNPISNNKENIESKSKASLVFKISKQCFRNVSNNPNKLKQKVQKVHKNSKKIKKNN